MPTVRLCADAEVGDALVKCECGRFRPHAKACGVPTMIGRAMRELGAAIKQFHYGCVAGGGQTDAHGAYIQGNSCAFCGNPAGEPPRRWSKSASATTPAGGGAAGKERRCTTIH